jgi:hypothetical protein
MSQKLDVFLSSGERVGGTPLDLLERANFITGHEVSSF